MTEPLEYIKQEIGYWRRFIDRWEQRGGRAPDQAYHLLRLAELRLEEARGLGGTAVEEGKGGPVNGREL